MASRRLNLRRHSRLPPRIGTSPPTALRPAPPSTSSSPAFTYLDLFPPHNPSGFFTSTEALMRHPINVPGRAQFYKLSAGGRWDEKVAHAARRVVRFHELVAKETKAVEQSSRPMWQDPLAVGTAGAALTGAWGGWHAAREKQQEPIFEEEERPQEPSRDWVASVPRRPSSPSPAPARPPQGRRRIGPGFNRGVHTGKGFSIADLRSGRRSFSSSAVDFASAVAERRSAELAAKIPAEKEIDLKQVMDDLRDLELLDMLREAKPKSGTGFKDATRALYPLFHQLDQGKVKKVSFGQLQDALPPIFSLPWTHISERLLTGRLYKLDSLSEKDKAQLLFLQLYNIGPTRAWTFANAGCRTFADLEKLQETEKIKLNKAQKIGLKHRENIQRLIPRDEMEKLKLVLEKALKDIDPAFECEILGSYRRGVPFSSDIDLAIRHPDFLDKDDEETSKPMMKKVVEYLEKHKLLEKDNRLMLGGKKYAGLARLPRHKHYRRIDIRFAPYHSYPYMLLGSTGDALLMKLLRHVAKSKKLCLNEYGMGVAYSAEDQNPNGFKPGTLRVVKSEKEIFELLGMPYLKPEEREYRIWTEKYQAARVPALEYLHKL
ncbi:hypothetical protein JCM6882_007197 [Rhodosporidiobolus microsporus]